MGVEDDKWTSFAHRPWCKMLFGVTLLVSLVLLVECQLMAERVAAASPRVPGMRVAVLALIAPSFSLVWIVTAVAGCYKMHESLRDPDVTFPMISELGVGPTVSKALY